MAQESWQLNDPKMGPPTSLASPPPPHPEVLPSPCLAPDQSPPPSVLAGDLSASKSAGQPYPATALVGESSNSMSAAGQLYAATLASKSSIAPSVGQSLATTLPGKPSAVAAAALVGQSYSAASMVESSFPSPSPSPLLSPQTQVVLSSSSAAASAAAPASPNTGGRSLRCLACRKRVGLAGFKCRCGGLFCPTHRYSDKHPCAFDYKAAGREAIAKANPIVKAIKITKI